jgi:hypothetical protein
MKRNTIYIILIVLMFVLFTSNFIIFRMKNEFLTITTSLTVIVQGVLILKDKKGSRNKLE